jgi:hypothetical protein
VQCSARHKSAAPPHSSPSYTLIAKPRRVRLVNQTCVAFARTRANQADQHPHPSHQPPPHLRAELVAVSCCPSFAIPKPAAWVWPCWTTLLNWPDSTPSNSFPNHSSYLLTQPCPTRHPLASNNHPLQDGKLHFQMVGCIQTRRVSLFLVKFSHADAASQAARRQRGLRHWHFRRLVQVLQT